MDALHFETEIECVDRSPDCSWASIISGIRCYARSQPLPEADSLNEWADLLEGIREMRGEA